MKANHICASNCLFLAFLKRHLILSNKKFTVFKTIFLVVLIFILNTGNIRAQEHASLKDGLRAEAALLFEKRYKKENLEKSVELLNQILIGNEEIEILSLLSRAYYLMAEYENDKSEKLRYYDLGLKSGERALMAIEAYAEIMKEGKQRDEPEAIAKLDITHIEALYWTAANVARYAKYAPFRQKLVLRSRVSNLWKRVFELDPDYFYAGAYRFYGGYYALVPSITGDQDIKKSAEMFVKAIELAPEYLETKVLYAEAYAAHAQIKDAELFRKLLQEVIEFDIESYPDIKAENLIAQQKAGILLKEENDLFE